MKATLITNIKHQRSPFARFAYSLLKEVHASHFFNIPTVQSKRNKL